MLRNQVGISNDLASSLYSRSSAEIITSRTVLSGDNNFTDAGQLVRCHNNEVILYHYQCNSAMSYFTDV
jgi:hypothetical protein